MNVAIILAAGIGSRVGAEIPKQFIEVLGKPVLAYTLEIFQKNQNIDAIELVCHKDWLQEANDIIKTYGISKVQYVVPGGDTFQESAKNGVFNLKGKIKDDDIALITYGVSAMTAQEIIDDSIAVCKQHGNAVPSENIVFLTCYKDDEFSTTQNLIRETIKGFNSPQSFRYGELLEAYETAIEKGILDEIEPHTTSLYLALGKRLWFSKSRSDNIKITTTTDLDIFEGYLMLKEKRAREGEKR